MSGHRIENAPLIEYQIVFRPRNDLSVIARNRMKRAEDSEFSVPLQGSENKRQFFGFVVALNVGRAEKIEPSHV
jgi:hypothetical protein